MQSLQVLRIITTGTQSVMRYSGLNSPWPGITTAILVSCIRETTVPHSTVIWSSFTLAHFLFSLPLLYLSFYPPLVEFTRQFSKCSSSIQTLLSSCFSSATLPLRL